MNVFGYCRVSGKSQVDGDGLPRQEDAIEVFSKVNGLSLKGVFREEGVSGTVEGLDRPEFSELIAYIDERCNTPEKIEAVVVERLDRLARDLMVSEVLLAELRKRGLKLFSTDQGTLIDMASDGGDPTRVLIRQIMGALAQWEKTMLVKKLRAAKDRLRAAGKLTEGAPAFGKLPGERDILQFMLANNPAMNYSQLATLMNSGGNLNRSGRPWKAQNIRDIILNHRKKHNI